jgi:hypothetical protein
MDKILVAVFEHGSGAHEGVRILRELDAAGAIDLFGSSVVAKDDRGDAEIVHAAEPGPLGTAVRRFTERLLLALALRGPAAATLCARMPDRPAQEPVRLATGEDLLALVATILRPGGYAVVAELWEQWVQPVDAQLSASGAVVLRRPRENAAAEIERERAGLGAERAELERRRQRASKEDQAALERTIEAVEHAIRAVQDLARAQLASERSEHEAKNTLLVAKLEGAQGPAKARLDARISSRMAEHRHRIMALMRAAL